MSKPRVFFQTVFAAIVAAVLYGEIHDQITIRICPEYFTVWHPHVSETKSLTLLAMIWGVIATWWMGAILGIVLGIFALQGPLPPVPFKRILRALARILGWTGLAALIVGIGSWAVRHEAFPYVMGADLYQLGPDFRRRFGVDYDVHNTSYFVGFIATLVYGALLLTERVRLNITNKQSSQEDGGQPHRPSVHGTDSGL